MFVRARRFLCLTLLPVVVVIAEENNSVREADGYARLLCSVLQSSNSEDPEIRANAVLEGLAYLDGETADVLRVLLLTKEEDPTVRAAIVQQLARSRRKLSAVDCFRHLADNSQPQKQKSRLLSVIQELEKVGAVEPFHDKARVHMQPANYVGPLSATCLKTLHDGETRTRIYRLLAAQPGRSSTEILQLFRSVETDAARAEDLDRQIGKSEDSRSQRP